MRDPGHGSPAPATAATIGEAADDLAAAFHDDPIFDWFLRADARREEARRRMFRLLIGEIAFQTGVVERAPEGGAAAAWIASERLGPNPLLQELRAIPTLLGATGVRRFGRLAALREAMDSHHPKPAHDYLWFLGVRPEAQGRGIGSRLLSAHTLELDRRGRPAWLETATPRNVPLYRRFGFEIAAEYRPAGDGPLIWGMWRDPSHTAPAVGETRAPAKG